jgi:hypothetical protein
MRRLAVPAAALSAVLLYGGYGAHWSWTGINGHTATLWDWLHLIALPLAAVLLTLWLRHRPRLGRTARVGVLAGLAAFGALVLAGYAVPWGWTGFTGNTLWDWLNLALLPLAVVLIPVMVELTEAWERRHQVSGLGALAGFGALVAAGYLIPWRWTGFTGNTLWDWLHLLLLPLVVPVVIVPVIRSLAMTRMGIQPPDDLPEAPGEGEAEVAPAGQEAQPT